MIRLAILGMLLVTALLPALADADPGSEGIPFAGFDPQPQLTPGGVAVLEQRGHRFTVTRLDAATGARTTLATLRIDKRTEIDFDPVYANLSISGDRMALAFAQYYTSPFEEIVPLGGNVFSVSAGGRLTSLHSCATETDPAPIDLDGNLLVAADRTTCGRNQDIGEKARFDIVAYDLAAGTSTVLQRGVIPGDDLVAVRQPYAAFGLGQRAGGEGYGSGEEIRVVDLRSGAEVTRLPVEQGTPSYARSIDVGADGRVVLCDTPRHLEYANPGETALHVTSLPCNSLEALPDGTVVAQHGRQVSLEDPVAGTRRTILRTKSVPSFDTDGRRFAWTDANCSTGLVHVAPIESLPASPAPRLACRPKFGRRVELSGRRARIGLTCPNGCAGSLQLYLSGENLPSAFADVNPAAGEETLETIPLDRETAARLRRLKKVRVVLSSDFDGRFYSATRRIVRR